MRRLTYKINEAAGGLRAENFLLKQGYSRKLIVALKQTEDGLAVGGRRIRSTTPLQSGEILEVTLPRENSPARHNLRLSVPVLYEDEDILVCSKPAGMPCHRSGSHIDDTLENAFADRGRFRAVFRLDADTSGLLLAAKHQLAAGTLWQKIEKQYLAVVQGELLQGEGAIELPLMRERPYEPRQIVSPYGTPARTEYRVLASNGKYSLLRCIPRTGRMHQIRAHLAHIGHPLAGDALYGGNTDGIARQALHCACITFEHPLTNERMVWRCSPPDDILKLLEAAGMQPPERITWTFPGQ